MSGSPGLWPLALLAALAAGYVQGFAGMGFAVVATPLLVLLYRQPHQVVMLSLVLGSVLCLGVLLETRREANPRRTWPLLVFAVPSTFLGVAVQARVNARTLTILIAVAALVTAITWVIRLPPPVRRERVAVSAAGVLGGFLNGATSIGGPPPALVVSMQRWEVSESRAALAAFNLVCYITGLAVGLGPQDGAWITSRLWLLPVAVAGALAGAFSVRRVPREVFRRALLATVLLAGLFALLSVFFG